MLMRLYCSRSGFDEGRYLLCSQVFAQFAAQRQAHTNAHTGDRGDILGAEAHTAGVAGSVQALDGLIILVQHLLVIGGHKAAGGHQCKAQTRGGDMGVEGSLCNCIQEVRVLASVSGLILSSHQSTVLPLFLANFITSAVFALPWVCIIQLFTNSTSSTLGTPWLSR